MTNHGLTKEDSRDRDMLRHLVLGETIVQWTFLGWMKIDTVSCGLIFFSSDIVIKKITGTCICFI